MPDCDSQKGSQVRVASAVPTYLRTNGRTQKLLTAVYLDTAVDAGARIEDSTFANKYERVTTDPPRPEPEAGTESAVPNGAALSEEATA